MIPRSDDLGNEATTKVMSTGGYAVLGLLLDGPVSGWDLAIAAGRSISHFWPVTRAHIYTELPKIAHRGWATSTSVAQRHSPDKRVYRATEAGRDAFRLWLATVDLTEERGRQPLQLQLFFAAHSTPEHTAALLDKWRRSAEQAELHCREILAHKSIDVAALGRLALSGDPADLTRDREPRKPGEVDARALTALFGLRRAQADQICVSEAQQLLLGKL